MQAQQPPKTPDIAAYVARTDGFYSTEPIAWGDDHGCIWGMKRQGGRCVVTVTFDPGGKGHLPSVTCTHAVRQQDGSQVVECSYAAPKPEAKK